MTAASSLPPDLMALQASLETTGAARLDAVGWHYIQLLSQRARAHRGPAQKLLNDKLRTRLEEFKRRWDGAQSAAKADATASTPSPLAVLLAEMAQHAPTTAKAPAALSAKPAAWRPESPKVQQFKQQLGKIRVQKQLKQAIAQAPQNAGPINSHMLVLRSLGLMRDASPDYLHRFMMHLDTLLCLEEAGKPSVTTKKSASITKTKK